MKDPIYRTYIKAGALIAPEIRAILWMTGVEFTEERGFLQTTFLVRGTEAQLRRVGEYVQPLQDKYGKDAD